MKTNIYRRLLDIVGKGGIKCYCCNPAKNCQTKKKHRIQRSIKHRIKNIIERIYNETNS